MSRLERPRMSIFTRDKPHDQPALLYDQTIQAKRIRQISTEKWNSREMCEILMAFIKSTNEFNLEGEKAIIPLYLIVFTPFIMATDKRALCSFLSKVMS